MIMCGTGHRPPKLGGYDQFIFGRLIALAVSAIDHYKPDLIISGMALGWDQALAQGAINAGVPFHAYIPCAGQEKRWPQRSRLRYHEILGMAEHKKYICVDYSPRCMQDRNIAMVDNSDEVLALWDGSSGGTSNCVKYAKSVDKEIHNLWSSWTKHK